MENLQLTLEILIVCLATYLAFFKYYFREKGKNLATLEDIEEITHKVESIKTDFIRETEKLKLDLQYSNQIRFSIKNEEIMSLFDFYEKYHLWLNVLIGFDFDDKQEILDSSYAAINDMYFKFLISEAKAELLINNPPIFNQMKDMKIETLKFGGFVRTSIIEYKYLLSQISAVETTTPVTEWVEKRKPLYDKKSEFHLNKHNELLKYHKKIAPMNEAFRKLVYELLLSMTGTENKVDPTKQQ